jgi:uncharacterized protein (TIGR02246 family)
MLKSLTAALAIATLTCTASANELPRTPEEAAKAFEKHFNAGNVDALLSLYAPGAVFVPAAGVQLNSKEQIKGALQQFMGTKLPIKVTVRQIYQGQDTAIIISDWTMDGKGPDGKPMALAGTGADVVQKRADGSWLYTIDNPFGVARAQ